MSAPATPGPAADAAQVAIVVPAHGRPERLADCLAALAVLEGGPYRAIVVDDGSPEPLAPVCAPFPFVTCIRQANAGPAAARNRGARESRADLLAFTDDDCRPRPAWVRALLAAQAGDGRRLVAGRVVNAFPDNPFAEASQSLADWIAARQAGPEGPLYATSNNLAVARMGFEALGGFDESFPLAAGEDRDFGLRWRAGQGPIVLAPEAVVDHAHALDLPRFWRQHANYGRGAFHVHRLGQGPGADAGSAEGRRLERAGFYLGLLGHPLADARRPWRRRMELAALMGLSQAATTWGYLRAMREER